MRRQGRLLAHSALLAPPQTRAKRKMEQRGIIDGRAITTSPMTGSPQSMRILSLRKETTRRPARSRACRTAISECA